MCTGFLLAAVFIMAGILTICGLDHIFKKFDVLHKCLYETARPPTALGGITMLCLLTGAVFLVAVSIVQYLSYNLVLISSSPQNINYVSHSRYILSFRMFCTHIRNFLVYHSATPVVISAQFASLPEADCPAAQVSVMGFTGNIISSNFYFISNSTCLITWTCTRCTLKGVSSSISFQIRTPTARSTGVVVSLSVPQFNTDQSTLQTSMAASPSTLMRVCFFHLFSPL
jgi:hypothetical protein